MPIYEFRCAACGQTTEKFFRSANADNEIECPHCAARASRQLSAFAIPRGATPTSDSGGADNPAGGMDDFGHGHSHGTMHGHSHGHAH